MIFIKVNTNSDTVVGVQERDLKYKDDRDSKTITVKENTIFKKEGSNRELNVVLDGFIHTDIAPCTQFINTRLRQVTNSTHQLEQRVWDAVKQYNIDNYNVDSYMYISDVDVHTLASEDNDLNPLSARFKKYIIDNSGDVSTKNIALPNIYTDARICHGSTGSSQRQNQNEEEGYHNIIKGFFSTDFNDDLTVKEVVFRDYAALRTYFIERRATDLDIDTDDIEVALSKIERRYEISLNTRVGQRVNIAGVMAIACLLGCDYSIFKVA